MNKFIKSYWGGFITALILSFIVSYITWPKIPIDSEVIDGTKVILPKVGDPMGISYPADGDKVEDIFVVYGSGMAFENQAMLELVDANDQLLLTTPVYFNSPEPGTTGPFIEILNLNMTNPTTDTGTIRLYDEDMGTGNKKILDDVRIRF